MSQERNKVEADRIEVGEKVFDAPLYEELLNTPEGGYAADAYAIKIALSLGMSLDEAVRLVRPQSIAKAEVSTVLKSNPYHDKSGLFTSKDKASGLVLPRKPGETFSAKLKSSPAKDPFPVSEEERLKRHTENAEREARHRLEKEAQEFSRETSGEESPETIAAFMEDNEHRVADMSTELAAQNWTMPPAEKEKVLGQEDPSSFTDVGHGISAVYVIEMENGSKAVFKPHDGESEYVLRGNIELGLQTEREVAAWEVAKIVGMDDMVAACVDRTLEAPSKSGVVIKPRRGAVMEFHEGSIGADLPVRSMYDGAEHLARAAVYDFVIGNEDRHAGNWIVQDGKLKLFDHGLAFPDLGQFKINCSNAYFLWEMRARENDDSNSTLDDYVPKIQDYVKPYVEGLEKIKEAMRHAGLPESAITHLENRVKYLQTCQGWYELSRRGRIR